MERRVTNTTQVDTTCQVFSNFNASLTNLISRHDKTVCWEIVKKYFTRGVVKTIGKIVWQTYGKIGGGASTTRSFLSKRQVSKGKVKRNKPRKVKSERAGVSPRVAVSRIRSSPSLKLLLDFARNLRALHRYKYRAGKLGRFWKILIWFNQLVSSFRDTETRLPWTSQFI